MNIPNRYTRETIWEGTIEAFRDAIAHGALNLSNADLRGADLSYEDLHGAHLNGADLHGAHLNGVGLHGVDLTCADLSEVDLSDAHLSGADLNGADLNGADLSSADLRGANLTGANLTGANLGGRPIRTVMGIGPIGSRGDSLIIWFMEDGTRLYSTGCQNQISEELLLKRNANRVNGGEEAYAAQYVVAVEFARAMSKIPEEAEK